MIWSDLPFKRPVGTLMLLVSLTVLGAVSVFLLPLDFMPEVAEPEVDIDVPFPGSHPLENLRQVVRPIEEEVATIPGVDTIFGFTRPGSAEIEVQFDWSADIELKKMEVREAVERARARLPAGVGHVRVEGNMDGPGAQVLQGRIAATRDLSESWDLLDRRIRRPLERIGGVARVDLYGVEAQEVRVDLDHEALKRHGVDVAGLVRRIDDANVDLDLGSIRGDVLRYDVRSAARFVDVRALADLRIGHGELRLRDVADVRLREPVLEYGRHLNRNFAIGLDVYREPTANTVETVDGLLERIEEIRRDPQLEGIELLVWENAGEEIRIALTGLRNAGMFGGLLAVGVLFFFLRRISTTLIVAVAIPFSLLVTCGAMLVTGFNFNVLTLLGLMLGVGMLVDNAVVVIENIYRLQRQGVPSVRAAREGTRQVALAVTAATATTLIVWSWLFIAEKDQLTIYVGEVALVLCLAVSCSWLISLTFIPLAAARFVPHRELRPGFFETRLAPAYRRLMRRTMRARALTLTCLLGLAATAVIPFSLIEIQGNPREQTRDVAIYYRIYDQVTKEVAEGYVNRIEDWLDSRRDELGYEYVYSWYSETQGTQTRVYLPDEATNERAIERLRDQLQTGLPVIPGVEFELGEMRHHHHEPSRAATARIALHGEDPEYLEGLARDVEQRMRGLPDLVEVYGPSLEGRREARILVDAERAHALDVTPRDVADVVAFWFRGQQLRRFEGPRGEVELIVGLPETARPGLDSIPDLQIPRADREPITLGAVAEVVVARTPPHIIRVDRKTTSHVTVEFDDAAVTTEEAQERVAQRMEGLELPEGYAWDWGQRRHREGDALATMGKGVVLSLILVLLLMAALFESFSQPLAILITLPLAFFGLFWALWLFGLVFEPVAFIGLIILIGIVVNNGIVMVEHVNALRRQGRSREDALVEGCGDRLRPVLMTAITTVVGLTPLALSKFTVAGVYIDSMAVGMIGGLLSSSLFTLLALPVWYTTVEDVGAILAGLLPRWWGRLAAGGVLTRTPR